MRTYLRIAALALGAFVAATAFAAEPEDPAAQAIMKRLVEAVKNRSYDDFVADADDRVKQALTKQMFEGVCGQLSPTLREGYKTVYLGKLRKQGLMTHLWRLETKQGQEDLLVRVSIKDGHVAGVWFQ